MLGAHAALLCILSGTRSCPNRFCSDSSAPRPTSLTLHPPPPPGTARYLETASGHHWLAQRVPVDSFFVSANQGRFQVGGWVGG